jgi:hypothetical protein
MGPADCAFGVGGLHEQKHRKIDSPHQKQKWINIILSVLIPFVWSVLLYYILKKEPNYFDKRKVITNDKLEGGFYILAIIFYAIIRKTTSH